MLATFSIENLISQGLAELDCSAAVFAGISGIISPTRLSRALSGLQPLENSQAVALLKVLERMRRLSASVAPTPVAYKNASLIRAILEKFAPEGSGAE